jgi:uncharacterized protein YjbI with pentapeptide repeats
MDFVNETGLEAAWIVSQIKPSAFLLAALVKGTFQLRPGEAAILADEQLPLTGDVFEAGDPARPLRYPFDFAPFKPRADVLLVGTCHAPGGVPAPVVEVSFQVGSLAKSLTVCGERHWAEQSEYTVPEPFVTLPLTWEAAYGGAGYDQNPLGKGFKQSDGANGTSLHLLPNIEVPGQPLRTSSDKTEPAGFGPIPDTWPQRLKKFGSFDAAYVKERWPGYPRNFDSGFFNTAPDDQQIAGYLTGDEVFTAGNLHPTLTVYRGRLPGLRIRAFLNEVRATEQLREIPMRLDTLWLDMDAEQLVLVWRGHLPVSSEQLEEVSHLLVAREPTSQEPPGTIADYQLLLDDALARKEEEDEELEEEEEEEEAEPEEEAEEPSTLSAASADAQEGTSEEPQEQEEQASDDEEALTEARVKEMIALRRSFAGCDLSDLALHRLDFSGLDLRGAILEGTTLAESNLSGADLSGAVLAGANLHGTTCTGTNFAEADFTEAWLVHADLTGANLTGADLTKAQLRGAVLRGVEAAESVFAEADLSDANLEEANLTAADLCGSRLHRTNLASANLTDAALENAWGCNLEASNAVLHKVRGAGALLSEANFRGATGEEAVWQAADLYAANFTGAKLPRAEFSGAHLRLAVFDAATIKEARFDEANLRGARMVRCNLYETSLQKADLTGVDLSESNLFGATLMDTVVQNTNFTGANLRRIKTREDVR